MRRATPVYIKKRGVIHIGDNTLTARQQKNFSHARHMAEMSDFRRARVGCVAVIGGRVVATGFSQHKTHPLQRKYNQYRKFDQHAEVKHSLHAETAMLAGARHLGIDWSKCDVYVYRICHSRPSGLAKPCASCRNALLDAGVRSVFYSTDRGFGYEKLLNIEREKK